jgi:L-methionine (R)-S-oxide reductase
MTDKKERRYKRIQRQLKELLIRNTDILSRMATINAVLYHKMDGFFWVGFYLIKDDKLMVGPYQGPLACLELTKNKGVCWEGINTGKSIVVPDVHEFLGHIACDSRSKSEIVVPVRDKNNTLIGVLDIDSNVKNNFDSIDVEQLEMIIAMLFQY